MPIHDSGRLEHNIDSGHINIVTDDGQQVPAYWAQPRTGQRFSGICLLHDWWGLTPLYRLLANFLGQMGYYVIVPDMYLGLQAKSAREALSLLQKTEQQRYGIVDAALTVLETHHRTNRLVAVLGLGMGGTLSFEAAIKRDDLEAAIAFAGFPQQYLGQFHRANTPLLAIYGSEEPYTKPNVIQALQAELSMTRLREHHRVQVIQGAGHDFFHDQPIPEYREISKQAVNTVLAFLEKYLEKPSNNHSATRY
jgi:carboxymethylenebutenolidase